jgi:hypothetical protein
MYIKIKKDGAVKYPIMWQTGIGPEHVSDTWYHLIGAGNGKLFVFDKDMNILWLSRLTGALILLPWAVPAIANGVMWGFILNPRYGHLNALLLNLGILKEPISYLGHPFPVMVCVIIAYVWHVFPFSAFLFHAALQNIPKEFDEVFALTRGGPGTSTCRSRKGSRHEKKRQTKALQVQYGRLGLQHHLSRHDTPANLVPCHRIDTGREFPDQQHLEHPAQGSDTPELHHPDKGRRVRPPASTAPPGWAPSRAS